MEITILPYIRLFMVYIQTVLANLKSEKLHAYSFFLCFNTHTDDAVNITH